MWRRIRFVVEEAYTSISMTKGRIAGRGGKCVGGDAGTGIRARASLRAKEPDGRG